LFSGFYLLSCPPPPSLTVSAELFRALLLLPGISYLLYATNRFAQLIGLSISPSCSAV